MKSSQLLSTLPPGAERWPANAAEKMPSRRYGQDARQIRGG